MQQTAERRSRFERDRPPGLAITERDIAILEATARHRFVRSTHVQALMSAEPGVKILRRLHKLYHNGYVNRPRAQIDCHLSGGGSKPMAYASEAETFWTAFLRKLARRGLRGSSSSSPTPTRG